MEEQSQELNPALRHDKRLPDALRPITFQRHYTSRAAGSVLVCFGETRILCTVCTGEGVPRHRVGKGGWLTAEYGMLPSSTNTRKNRPITRLDGRSAEIQRLIGRSLRAIVDLSQIENTTLYVDCDVLQADGGTRTASITGAYLALYDACLQLKKQEKLKYWPLIDSVSAVSVGIVQGQPLLDLDYHEDIQADVDMNIVMRGNGEFIELQGTAEQVSFNHQHLQEMIALGAKGCQEIGALQHKTLNENQEA